MREFDTDSDGKLSFTEFQVILKIVCFMSIIWPLNCNNRGAHGGIKVSITFYKTAIELDQFGDFQKAVEKLKERESQGWRTGACRVRSSIV